MNEAIWRNSTVQLVKRDASVAVIRTPCGYFLRVRVSEISAADRKRKPRGDHHSKF